MSRNGEVAKIVLGVIGAAGVLSMALVAPGCVKAAIMVDQALKQRRRRDRWYFDQVIIRLAQEGKIKLVKNESGIICAQLTSLGKNLLDKYELGEARIKKPKSWDRKYRLIIFDIKEGKREIRDELRNWLLDLGFVRLQNSVWVHPYECREVITLLKSNFQIGNEILYLTVETIENDRWLRQEFDLD